MLRKMDGLLGSFAKLVATAADFFGIGKPLLIFIWILLSGITWCLPVDTRGFAHVGTMCVCGLGILTPIQLLGARYFHMMFSLLKELGLPTPSLFPVRLLAMYASLISTFHFAGGGILWLIVGVKLLTPLLFWLYFFDCEGGSKYKLKEVVKGMVRRLRENFLPNPAPVPNLT